MLSEFPYIKVPERTGEIKIDTFNLLSLNHKEKTFAHVQAVAETSSMLAEKFGLDQQICEISGYLHDISAILAPSDMLCYAKNHSFILYEAEKRYPFLLHQRISRLIAANFFAIDDERILSSIECHSTLKAKPSDYDLCLFVADKLSWDQDGVPPYYQILTTQLENSLVAASVAYMDYIVDKQIILYPHEWFIEGVESLRNFT